MNATAVDPLHLAEQRVPGTPPSLAAPRRGPIAPLGAMGRSPHDWRGTHCASVAMGRTQRTVRTSRSPEELRNGLLACHEGHYVRRHARCGGWLAGWRVLEKLWGVRVRPERREHAGGHHGHNDEGGGSLVQKRAKPSARLGRPICVILRQVAGHAGGGGLGFGAGSPLDGTADRVRHPLSGFPRL